MVYIQLYMKIIDYIQKIFKSNKRNVTIYAETLRKNVNSVDCLEIGLYDDKKPIPFELIGIEIINGQQYIKQTDENGIALLNINLNTGKYTAKIYYRGNAYYNKNTAYAEIFVTSKTRMEGTDMDITEGDEAVYQCAVYDENNNRVFDIVDITVNGVKYTKTCDTDGLYKLNIKLPSGAYNITSEFKGNSLYESSTITNTIQVNPRNNPVEPIKPKKTIVLGCDSNTTLDNIVQSTIAQALFDNGYNVEKLPIGPNYFASYDYTPNSSGKIGIYLIASGIFSIADANYGSGQFDNYIFGIRGDFGDKGATCFDCPIKADADCTSICDELDGKTFNQINAMLQPYVSVVGGADSQELANNILDWLNALEHLDNRSDEQKMSIHERVLKHFEETFNCTVDCIDTALEIIQGMGYAFYFSDGFNVFETIDRIANGDGANCYDVSEVIYNIAKALDYDVEYLDVYCPVNEYDHIRLRLKRNGSDWFYRDPACVLDGGDITDNWCGTSDNIIEVNPAFIYTGD